MEWQETIDVRVWEHPEWRETDTKHIPWRVIEERRQLGRWKSSDLDRVISPKKKRMPFEEAERRALAGNWGTVYTVDEHPDTYGEILTGPQGYYVYIHFANTGESVTFDIDILFLYSNIGFRIQQIVRATQLRELERLGPNDWEGLA